MATVGYIRVSSFDQNPERQLDGLTIDETFTDTASGKDVDRPAFEEMMRYVRKGDLLVVHSIDRLARNTEHLRRIVRELTGKGVQIKFVKENLTFSGDDSPISILMLSIMGAFAEFERSLIRERQREGIALAKQRGVYKGKKKLFGAEKAEEIRRRVMGGEPKSHIAKELGITRTSVYNYLRRAAQANSELYSTELTQMGGYDTLSAQLGYMKDLK